MLVKGKHIGYNLYGKMYHCPMDITMNFIGGKWKSAVLIYLTKNTLRFHELKNRMPDITEKMLSIQLKKLEADGLIIRQVLKQKPPLKVEYFLSDFGKTLTPALDAISKWGENLGKKEGKSVEIKPDKQ